MKRSFLILLLFTGASLSLSAQTSFPVWNEFRSDRFGFSIQYPDMWTVNEQANGTYVFANKDPQQSLGTYTIVVENNNDSATAQSRQISLRDEHQGSTLTKFGTRSLLTYKTVAVRNGVDLEIHHWIVAVDSRLFLCSYSFPTQLRNSTQMVDELTMAYKMIEMLNFIE